MQDTAQLLEHIASLQPQRSFVEEGGFPRDRFYDVIFIVEGQEVPCHRCILSARSSAFRDMLLYSIDELMPRITITDLSTDAFMAVIEYCYSGNTHVEDSNVALELIRTLGLYNLPKLKEAAELQVASFCTFDHTVLPLLRVAHHHNASILKKVCITHILANYAKIALSEEYQELEQDVVYEILKEACFRIAANATPTTLGETDAKPTTRPKSKETNVCERTRKLESCAPVQGLLTTPAPSTFGGLGSTSNSSSSSTSSLSTAPSTSLFPAATSFGGLGSSATASSTNPFGSGPFPPTPTGAAVTTPNFSIKKPAALVMLRDGSILTEKNAFKRLEACIKAGNNTDIKRCVEFIDKKFNQVLASKPDRQILFNLSKEALIELLKSDDLAVSSEYDLLLFVSAWADKRIERAMKREVLAKAEEGKEEEKGKEKESKDEGGEKQEEKQQESPSQSAEAKEEEVVLPKWKTTKEYFDRLRQELQDLAPYIRFTLMPSQTLVTLEEQGFIPNEFIQEAIRNHVLKSLGKEVDTSNPRFRNRTGIEIWEWNPERMENGIILSNDLKTASKRGSCGRSTVMAKTGWKDGVHSWEILLNGQAGCYASVGVAAKSFDTRASQALGSTRAAPTTPTSWGYNLTPGYMGFGRVPTLTETAHQLAAGTVVRLVLDLENHTLTISNTFNSSSFTFNGVTCSEELYPALTICHSTGGESYTLRPIDLNT